MNWHSGLPSLHCPTPDALMANHFPEFGFHVESSPPSPSVSPTFSAAQLDTTFDTWQPIHPHHLLTSFELQAMDSDNNGSDNELISSSQEIYQSSSQDCMLQVPTREMPFLSRFSPYPGSPSPQPQSYFHSQLSLEGTPVPGSPNPQHLDAAQFWVLMNEATNRVKALATDEYVSVPQPPTLATRFGLMHPSLSSPAYPHNVYLRRSPDVESFSAEHSSMWSNTAEQVG
ncbi:hypothetical protein BGX29_008971, partial [Mortierella sp. GBA35]